MGYYFASQSYHRRPETKPTPREPPPANSRGPGREDSQEAFDEALKKVARRKPPHEKPPRSPKPKL